MTMVLTDRTTNYDGSPTGDNDVYTATGPIVVTFSRGSDSFATCKLFSRSDTADYVLTGTIVNSSRVRFELVSGDQFYFIVRQSDGGDSVDLSYVDA